MRGEGRNILSQAGIYLAARGLPGVVSFLAIPLFSRLLSPADYGRYALALATVGVLNALLFQWLRLSLVRYLPGCKEDPVRLKSTLATAGGATILAAGAVAAVACLLPITNGWRAFIALCWVALAIQATFELCCEYARGALEPWHYMRLQLARAVSFVALGVVFVKVGAGWWGPLAGAAVGMTAASLLAWRRDWSGTKALVDRDLLLRLAHYGVPLSLTVALTVVISSSDRYVIAWRLGEDAAGLYSVAVDFTTQTITLLMMVVHMAMFPIAVRDWERGGPEAARDRMRTNGSLLLAIGVPCVVGLAVLAPGIAHSFLGQNFRAAAASIMPLVALGTFLGCMKAFHFDAAFQFAHRTLSQVWIVLVAAVLNVALNLLAVPRWGINGAAGASVLAFLVAIALTVAIGLRHVALPVPARAGGIVLLGASAMGALLYPLRAYVSPAAVAAQVAVGALVYGATLLACDFMGCRTQLLAKRTRGRAAPVGASRPDAERAIPHLAPVVSEVG
jgi:O-antigen/teichoic acid export membrane protein